MIANIYPNIKPISDYAAIMAEIEHWKEKFYDLQAQISEIRQTGTDTIIIKEGGIARYIRLADIIMMEAESNYTTIHFVDGQRILTSKTLKYWIEKIGDETGFIRPHRSFLVNKTHIVSYQKSAKSLLLTHGRKALVARSYKF
jgi:two-component system LytT family response regulator